MMFLANENVPLDSVYTLRAAGHDVAAIILDSSGAKDPDVLARATKEGRIILTFDRDYGELLYKHGKPAPVGIVHFRFDPIVSEEPAATLLTLIADRNFSLEGKYTVITRSQVRQRTLP
jgi:predicted nuclease of predicted toxin-antitoxin system